ncbi:hypothetical protein EV681_4554 [Advenella incenata]|uniref:Uncharacterized protein n=1 Tax=Advenella incenata TaxID=267800 RepID=A0A4Q7V6Z1_9BURK|nr:DUF6012 family protein [Advenella incenata]RZT91200.1 hypothetical protein EV681_4554 [Advenella incenata]
MNQSKTMLYHFVPRLLVYPGEPECSLIDFSCPTLGLELRGGIELTTRRPYPNKRYLVACRKIGQKAMKGFLVESRNRVDVFTTVTRWAIGADRIIHHYVQYNVNDAEQNAVTEDMPLWSAMWYGLGGLSDRRPAIAQDWTPAAAQPRMELIPRSRQGVYTDSLDADGRITKRTEVLNLHTVEWKPVFNSSYSFFERIPNVEMAFQADPNNRNLRR